MDVLSEPYPSSIEPACPASNPRRRQPKQEVRFIRSLLLVCHNEASRSCEDHHEGDDLDSSTWKVHMSLEDLLSFITQDLKLRPNQRYTSSRTEGREERTRPLTTRVILQTSSWYAMLEAEPPLNEEDRAVKRRHRGTGWTDWR